MAFQVSGDRAFEVFRNEPGGHRWQRVPPTEKRGRVQTSTITVAVLEVPTPGKSLLDLREVDITTTRGDGKGGQNKNKLETEVIAVHRPTGIRVRVGNERSQYQNKQLALNILSARIAAQEDAKSNRDLNHKRKEQVGSGQRGDKIRTIRTQDNRVRCEKTGRTVPFTHYQRGCILF